MKTIAIIPARANSKGIRNKNIIPFCGKPLIYWTISQAKKSRVDEVYVSTDSAEIAKIASRYGANIVARPPTLAQEGSSSEDTIIHTLNDKKIADDNIVVFLQCTSPLRFPRDINNAINCLEYQLSIPRLGIPTKKADSIFSCSILKDSTIWKIKENKFQGALFDPDNRNIMRQNREKYYYENGSIYCFYAGGIRESRNRLHGEIGIYIMSHWKSFEIDEWEDIELCEYYFKKKGLLVEFNIRK